MSAATERVSLELETVEGHGLRFRGSSGPHSLLIDSGEGAVAANPVHLLMLSVGACTGMDVISILRKKRQAVTRYEVEVTGERRKEHPRAFTRLDVVHKLRGRGLSRPAVEEAVRLSATKYCSVSATVAGVAEIHTRIEIAEG